MKGRLQLLGEIPEFEEDGSLSKDQQTKLNQIMPATEWNDITMQRDSVVKDLNRNLGIGSEGEGAGVIGIPDLFGDLRTKIENNIKAFEKSQGAKTFKRTEEEYIGFIRNKAIEAFDKRIALAESAGEGNLSRNDIADIRRLKKEKEKLLRTVNNYDTKVKRANREKINNGHNYFSYI